MFLLTKPNRTQTTAQSIHYLFQVTFLTRTLSVVSVLFCIIRCGGSQLAHSSLGRELLTYRARLASIKDGLLNPRPTAVPNTVLTIIVSLTLSRHSPQSRHRRVRVSAPLASLTYSDGPVSTLGTRTVKTLMSHNY